MLVSKVYTSISASVVRYLRVFGRAFPVHRETSWPELLSVRRETQCVPGLACSWFSELQHLGRVRMLRRACRAPFEDQLFVSSMMEDL